MNWNELRTPLSLDGEWEFCLDPEGKRADDVIAGMPSVPWRKVNVPCDLRTACPEQGEYQGKCWFRKKFTLPEGAENRRTVVQFEAVNYVAFVYVNGRFVARNEQGFLPFEAEVQKYLKPEGEQTLLVMVDASRDWGDLPTFFGWKSVGGIIRSVSLYTTGEMWLKRPQILADIDGGVTVKVRLGGMIRLRKPISVSVLNDDGEVLAQGQVGAMPECEVSFRIENPALWSPDTPNLYHAEIEIPGEDWLLESFGFRKIEVRDGKIVLNGKPIFLKGFNRHEDTVKTGGAAGGWLADADFETMKDAGANFVRMCHYPHDEHEAELADRLGLILLEEIPLNALLVGFSGHASLEQVRLNQVHDNAREMLRRLVERDRNHPSVCIWSVSNELNESYREINALNDALLEYVRELDDTRLHVHVSIGETLFSDRIDSVYRLDDVICFNVYPSMSQREAPGEWLKEQILRLKAIYPGKPVIVTEFGYMTGMARDSVRDEALQAKCIREEYPAIREVGDGASVWEYADHLWPKYIDFISKELSSYGLLTRERKLKEAFEVYSELMLEE